MRPDPAALAAIHAEAFDAPWPAEVIAGLIEQPGVMALSQPDGFILCRVAVDEAEILTLAVRRAARRRGVGRALTLAAAEAARLGGARRLLLEVAVDNPAALGLYRALGFGEVGRRRGYYERRGAEPADALILALNLTAPLPSV